MCSAVVELHGTNAAQVVVITRMLRVAGRCRERGLQYKFVGLVVEIVVEVVAE